MKFRPEKEHLPESEEERLASEIRALARQAGFTALDHFTLANTAIVLIVVSVLADSIGVGSYPGFNWAQQVGTAVGVLVAVIGLVLAFRKPKLAK